jgi:flagellar basal-body rod protein FlgB
MPRRRGAPWALRSLHRQAFAATRLRGGKDLPVCGQLPGQNHRRRALRPAGTDVADRGCGNNAALEHEANMESVLGIHESALIFRAKRMEVLAANLANADTPHYKARDMEFATVLRGVTSGSGLRTTDARHIGGTELSREPALQYRVPHQPALDGNTVESDLELARYAENAVGYQASLQFATGKIATLRAALAGVRG